MAATEEEIDALVGRRVRELRLQLGLTQTQLADAIGVTFQQVQKYERGSNRISASKLWLIADRLGVSPASLYNTITSTPIKQHSVGAGAGASPGFRMPGRRLRHPNIFPD